MKKLTKLFTAFSLFVLSFSMMDLVSAETAKNAETRIEIEVTNDNTPLDPSTPPTDDKDPSKPGVIDPESDDESRPNENIGENDQLAIWRIPTDMKFKGEYDPVLDLELELEYDAAQGQKNRRVLSIADVRKGSDTEWKLTSQLVEFKEQGSSTSDDKLNQNISLAMNSKAMKHKVNGKHVYAKEFVADDNGVVIKNELEINNIENEVARAESGNGKGYTGLIFEDIKLKIKGGNVEGTNYSGKINWTLSETVN